MLEHVCPNIERTMDFSNLVTRDIDERFCYIKYDQFDLIMMKENNYVNATKLCKLGGREFYKWTRLDGTKELLKKVEEMNGIWKLNPTPPDLEGLEVRQLSLVINISNEGTNNKKYEVSGSYVHPDLIPHITSWISPLFAVKVSKVINCYMSGKYELKLKEKEVTNKELLELLYAFDEKYDRDTAELKERYREQRKEAKELKKQYEADTRELKSHLLEIKERNKELEKKYDRDTVELKEQNKELSKGMKRMEDKYDRDTRELKSSLMEIKERNKELEKKYDRDTKELKCSITELKTELKKVEERLKDKVINPSSPNKLHRLVILQKKTDPNAFRTLRVVRGHQAERINQELNKIKNDYRVFFNAYEPNAVSCFNNLKERLLSQEYVKVNYNDFTLCDVNAYGVNELYNDLQNLYLVRKYA